MVSRDFLHAFIPNGAVYNNIVNFVEIGCGKVELPGLKTICSHELASCLQSILRVYSIV